MENERSVTLNLSSEGFNDRFPAHFRDFIQQLNRFEAEYLLIGGYAMGAYGRLRGTGDLDIYINPTAENAEKLVQASIAYGILEEDLDEEMFLVTKMIGIGEHPLRIEISKGLNDIDFNYAYQCRKRRVVAGLEINVIGLDDLILLKRKALKDRGYTRDAEDLEYLMKLRSAKKSGGEQ